jgi:2',3'-cyclic-nucleotide 2'-phosphodiesterase (5'-nucleotidase family)
MPSKFLYSILLISLFISCRTRVPQGDDGKINLTLVQVNDVYEIAPLEGGKSGGMARVATLKKQSQLKNKNTLLLMAGDFVSPSVYGSLTYEGKRIRGRQMIDAMNAAGFDIVCFGNHEFDISEKDLQDRIDESNFTWISANAFHKINNSIVPFQKNTTKEFFPKYYFKNISDADGTTAKIGFISVVLPANPAEYVSYTDPVNAAIETYNLIKDSCDAIVALTHMAIKDDKRLAEALPGLAAILGGHEHDMKFEKVNGVYISKAHANAKSAYVVNLQINKNRSKIKSDPKLVYLDENVTLDSITNLTVQKWVRIANDNYASSGFDATAIIPYSGEPLEGREGFTRSSSTNLTRLVTDAMLFAAPQAEAAIFNSGSIRVDDVLYPPITQYDILRTLPFGGGVRELDIKGDLLIKVLDAGLTNKGSGGWLQFGNITYNEENKSWKLKDQPVDQARTYRIVVPDFLITGKETNLGFFNEQNSGVSKMYPAITTVGHPQSDIRVAIIKYLEQKK